MSSAVLLRSPMLLAYVVSIPLGTTLTLTLHATSDTSPALVTSSVISTRRSLVKPRTGRFSVADVMEPTTERIKTLSVWRA